MRLRQNHTKFTSNCTYHPTRQNYTKFPGPCLAPLRGAILLKGALQEHVKITLTLRQKYTGFAPKAHQLCTPNLHLIYVKNTPQNAWVKQAQHVGPGLEPASKSP